jgi:two-component system response regulator NreC
MKKLTISARGSAMSAIVRLAIFAKEPIVLKALRALLEKDRGITIVSEATSAFDTKQMVVRARPDVLLMASPPATPECLKLAYAPIAHHGKPKIVLLTRTKDPSRLLAFLDAGVCGYVLQSSKPEYLLDAIFRAAIRRRFIDPSYSDNVAELVIASTEAIPPASTARRLSRREQSVLQHIAAGHTNREIAKLLGIEITTVETYQWRLREKLGLTTRLDVVRYAVSTGILRRFSEVTPIVIGEEQQEQGTGANGLTTTRSSRRGKVQAHTASPLGSILR